MAHHPEGGGMMSPSKGIHGDEISDDSTALQLQQLLDDWHFRVIHSSLGQSWHRSQVIETVVSVLSYYGLHLSDEDMDEASDLGDDDQVIEWLVPRVPQDLRRCLDHVGQGLQVVVSMASRLRHGIEEQRHDEIQEVLEESDGTGIAQTIMKRIIVHATEEVVQLKRQKLSWEGNMKARLDRLMHASDLAQHASQQLLAVEAQLSAFGENQSQKNKKVLMGLSDGKTKTLLNSCFSNWLGHFLRIKAQKVIRDKYERMAVEAEDRLVQYREKKIMNIRNVLMRKAGESDKCMLALCVETWWEAVDEAKREGGTKAEMERMQKILANQRANAKANSTSYMAKMAQGQEEALFTACMSHWVKFSEEYKRDKELEDQVKKSEQALAKHMAQKKEEAKGVLNRMNASSGNGLLLMCTQGWKQHVDEEKRDRELANRLNGDADRFKSLQDRQSGNARGVQTRVNDQMKTNLLLRCVGVWQIDAKVARIDKYYQSKLEGKRKQLQSCQTLFKSFAAQLEQGLSDATEEAPSGNRSKSRKERPASGRPEPKERPPSGRPDQRGDRPASGRPDQRPERPGSGRERPSSGRKSLTKAESLPGLPPATVAS